MFPFGDKENDKLSIIKVVASYIGHIGIIIWYSLWLVDIMTVVSVWVNVKCETVPVHINHKSPQQVTSLPLLLNWL